MQTNKRYGPKQVWSHSRWSTQCRLVLPWSGMPSQPSAAIETPQLNAMRTRPSAAVCNGSACVPGLMQMPEHFTRSAMEN